MNPDWREVADQLAEAIRLTRDYVEPKVKLPAIPGWSWFDATEAYRAACESAAGAAAAEGER